MLEVSMFLVVHEVPAAAESASSTPELIRTISLGQCHERGTCFDRDADINLIHY